MTTIVNPLDSGRLLFGRHPSMWLSTLAAVLMLGPALRLSWLTGEQVAGINVAVAAVVGAVWAWQVRPIAPAVFTNVVTALAGLGAAYGLDLPSESVGVVQAIIVQVLGLITWGQVSPAGARRAVAPPAPMPALGIQQTVASAVRPPRSTLGGAHERAAGGPNPPRTY
ncbi:hypothetical protein [Micromonospora sp. NPDC049645]|uniref:hypothetical protein n=1 Tax=Micromonospora sp. NPDC049645 TaxID=3155508 RepID=UPI00342E8CE1